MSSHPIFYTAAIGNAPMFVKYFADIAGIGLDVRPLSIPKGEHKEADYLRVAPSGQVPGLRDGDVTVYESVAIVRYLAAVNPGDAYPLHDPVKLAPIDSAFSWLWFNAWTHERDIAVQTFVIALIRGGEADQDKVREARELLKRDFEFIEKTYFRDDPNAIVGTELTVADALMGTLLWHLECAAGVTMDLSVYPKLQAYWANMKGSPLYQETFAPAYAAVAALKNR